MTPEAVVPRRRALEDVEEAVEYYLAAGGDAVALGFIDALEEAYGHLARHLASGSSRYAEQLGLPGLRFCALRRYPYLVLYIERAERVDVWRVLNAERDIPRRLLES